MRWSALALAAIAVAGCHGERSRGAVPVDTAAGLPTMDTATHRAADATTDSTPPTTDSMHAAQVGGGASAATVVLVADSAAGDALFHGKGRCFTCHGRLGAGTPRLGPALDDSLWLEGDGSLAGIRAVIADGVGAPKAFSVAMPAYGGTLTSDEIARTAAYVYTLSHPGAAVLDTARADSARTDSVRADTTHARPQP